MTYLVKRDHVYYLRFRIPNDLLKVFGGTRTILRSLRTSREKQAQQRFGILSERTEKVVSILRSGMLSDEEAKRMVALYIAEGLKQFSEWRFEETPEPELKAWSDLSVRTMERLQDALQQDLIASQYTRFDGILKSFLSDNHLNVAKDTPEYRRLARRLLMGFADFLRIEIERHKGNFSNEFDSVLKNDLPHQIDTAKGAKDDGPLITAVIKDYFAEKESGKRWDIKTKQQVESSLDLMLEVLKDRPATSVTHKDMMAMRDAISRMPANRNKSPEYRNRPLADVLAMKHIKPISVTTVNNILNRIAGFWLWAETHEYIVKSPARHLFLRKSKRADEERAIYDKTELQVMLNVLARVSEPAARPERIWVSLIALHSGMRPNEIAQLYLDDVVEEGGVFCFRVNDTHPDQRVKNKNARRFVPVHPILLELGFKDYMAKVTPNATGRLFPMLLRHRDGYFPYLGRWFQNINRSHITKDRKKVFYSIRHNFITALKQAGVDPHVNDELTGHAAQGEIKRYAKPFFASVLLDSLKKVDYGLDMTAIRDAAKKTY